MSKRSNISPTATTNNVGRSKIFLPFLFGLALSFLNGCGESGSSSGGLSALSGTWESEDSHEVNGEIISDIFNFSGKSFTLTYLTWGQSERSLFGYWPQSEAGSNKQLVHVRNDGLRYYRVIEKGT